MSKEYERRRTGSSSKPPKGAADPKQPAAKTQNSPNAEPASGLTESKTLTARRLLDELILRDRVFADALAELRTSADRTLAESAHPLPIARS